MGLGSRVGARHQTAALEATSVRSADYYDFAPGQRVMTVDGYPGVVTAVQDGPIPGSEGYEVTLDGGMGGGLYSTSQLRPAAQTTAAGRVASEDYPELREILESRPDIAPDKVASKQAHVDTFDHSPHPSVYKKHKRCPHCGFGWVWGNTLGLHDTCPDCAKPSDPDDAGGGDGDADDAGSATATATLKIAECDLCDSKSHDTFGHYTATESGDPEGREEERIAEENKALSGLPQDDYCSHCRGAGCLHCYAIKMAHSGHTSPEVGPYHDDGDSDYQRLHSHGEDGGTYMPGLGCPHCDAGFFTEDARNDHLYEHHPDQPDTGQAEIDHIKRIMRDRGREGQRTAAEQDPSGGPTTDEALDQDPLDDYTAALSLDDIDGEWAPGNKHDYASHVRCPNCDSQRALVSADGTTSCQECGYNTVGHKSAAVEEPRKGWTTCPDCGLSSESKQPGDECPLCGGQMSRHPNAYADTDLRTRTAAGEHEGWTTCPDCGLSSVHREPGDECPLCGGQMTRKPEAWADTDLRPRSASADYRFLTIAASDSDFRWHVTASWKDVREKAKRLRTEGRVRIVSAHSGVVSGEVKGDHHVYETTLLKAPASSHVASWECGCKWASYSWGRSAPYRRFEGRMCSHALAMHYEAQARGMFGRTVDVDEKAPAWLRPRTRVVTEYDKDEGRNVSRPAQPRKRDVGRAFSVLHEQPGDGTTGSVVQSLVRHALHDGEDTAEVDLALHVARITGFPFIKAAVQERLAAPNNAPGNHPFASPVSADTGRYKMCSYCHGQGCEHCGWDGLVNAHSAMTHQQFAEGVMDEYHRLTEAAANDPFNEFGHDEDAPAPHADNGNPGSTGFATGPDPWFGHDERGLGRGVGIDAMSSVTATTDEARDWDMDPAQRDDPSWEDEDPFPFTHTPERPGRADATHYVSFEPDFDRLHSTNTLNADPEPALPQTDGEIDDDEGTPSTPSHPIAAARTEDDIVAAFQRQAAHLDPGQSAGPASSDIAQAARAHLAKTALKDFTPAEQQELISEGATEGMGAGNLADLDLSGTHYEQIEAALALGDEDDEGWLA